jgi:peroxiredoxin
MIRLMTTLFAIMTLMACKSDKNTFVLQGKIDGLTEEYIFLYRVNDLQEKVDTIKVKAGKFQLKSTIEEPAISYLSVPGMEEEALEIFLEPGRFIVSGNAQDPSGWKVQGGELQQYYDGFRQTILPIVKEYNNLAAERELIKKSGAVPEKVVEEKMETLKEKYYESIYNYLETKPANIVTAYIINSELLFDPDFERIDKIMAGMDSTVLKSSYAKGIEANLFNSRKTAPGKTAPNFSLPDMEGNTISLEQYKGKYVLVDFWASWCAPCRNENPRLLSIYQTYKGPQFEMLSISIDRARNQWKEAVMADKLSWTQVINENGVAEELYGVTIIPANILIDPNGKIVARNLFGTRLEKQLNELLKKDV